MDQRTRTGKANRYPGITERRGKCFISYTDQTGTRRQHITRWAFPAQIADAVKERNRLIRSRPVEQSKVPTFGELAQNWLDTADLTPASRRTAKSRLNTYWWPAMSGIAVDQITYADVRAVMAKTKHLAAKTRRNVLGEARSVFEIARKSGFIVTNPVSQFGKIKGDKPEPDPFTVVERDKLLTKLSGNAKLFYLIRFYCGLRPGEVIALTWADYDGTELTVNKQIVEGQHRTSTKTHHSRKVRVHPVVRDALSNWPTRFLGKQILRTKDHASYRRGDPLAESLNLAMTKAKVRYRSPYNARHTCATMMLEAGLEPAYCAAQLGHSIEMFLGTYAKWINQERSEQQAKIWEQVK